LGGESTHGLALMLEMVGGVVSRTVTLVDCVTGADPPSVTETVMLLVPSGNVAL
jgi:hypothetical protein